METKLAVPADDQRYPTEMDSLPEPYKPPPQHDLNSRSTADRSFRWLAITLAVAPALAVVLSGIVARPRFVYSLSNMAFQFFGSWLFVFPVSLPLAGWLAWLCFRAGVGTASFDWDRLHWLAIPATTPFFCLTWGVVFRHGRGSVYPDWQNDVIMHVLLVCFVSAMAAAIANRKHRWLSIAAGCNCLLLCFGSALLAVMSVTGDWL